MADEIKYPWSVKAEFNTGPRKGIAQYYRFETKGRPSPSAIKKMVGGDPVDVVSFIHETAACAECLKPLPCDCP